MHRSAVGSYSGYSEAVANGYVRSSQYMKVRDGCLIAVDVLRPALDGKLLGGRRAAIVRGTAYRRAFRRTEHIAYDVSRIPIIENYPIGHVITPYELAPVAKRLVDHGYVFVSVDLRGTGASFGSYDQPATIQSGRDLADIIDWLAVQDWSNGKIGMWGRSWEAAVQLVTAVVGTPNLTCICPHAIGALQLASTWYGGMFAIGFRWPFNELRKAMELAEHAMPVDGPEGESLRAEAVRNRRSYFPWPSPEALGEDQKNGAYAIDWLERSRKAGAEEDKILKRPRSVSEDAESINVGGVPIYWLEGWWDLNFVNSAVSLYNTLTVPKKMTVGPWTHSQFAFAHEPHRWFDYWLKGIDNGILDEPALHYSVSSTDGDTFWRAADRLPGNSNGQRLFFGAPKGAGMNLAGTLEPKPPQVQRVRYRVDYELSTGPQTRTSYLWKSVQMNYGDMSRRFGRCVSFTTEPLAEGIELTGVPSLHLPLAVSASPAAIFVTLEEVQPDGTSRYLTEGLLNLEYRADRPLPKGYFGRALHPFLPSERETVPVAKRLDIAIDMLALSVEVPAGRRLRVTIAGADRENYYQAPQDPPVELTLFCGGADGASLELPVVVAGEQPPIVFGTFRNDEMPFAFELGGS